MNVSKPPASSVTDQEILNMQHNLSLLRSQVQIGRIEYSYLDRQLAKLLDLLNRLHAQQQQHQTQDQLEALYNVTRLLVTSLDLSDVLNQVMDSIIQLTGAERGFMMLRGDDGQLEIQVARHFDQQALTADRFHFSRTLIYQVMDTGEPVNTFNATEDPRFADQASVIGGSLQSIMAVPLRVRGDVIGVIYVDNSSASGFFTERDMDALVAFAAPAALAIANARMHGATEQELRDRVDQLSKMGEIDMRLAETLDVDKTITYALEAVCRLSGAVRGHYGIVQDGRILTAQNYPTGSDDTQPFLLDRLYPPARDVVISGQMQVMQDSARGEYVLFVPVFRRNQEVFALVVLRRTSGGFSDDLKWAVSSVMTRAALAIENAQLHEAVQAADRAKSEFVGVVAHDLKVPMTSIVGYADLTLMDGGLQPDQEYYLSRIRDTVKRMEILVSDLADISRIESGLFYMDESRVRVEDIVQGVRDNIVPEIRRRRHAYIEQIEADLPDMRVDYYRLLQVLTNLLSNAYKYTPDGGSITLAARRRGDRIEFSVADTGIGLSAEARSRLGTKFWRAADEFTRSQPGTGLGYAITASLVEQMGSRIEIESEVGKGSRFTFTIATIQD